MKLPTDNDTQQNLDTTGPGTSSLQKSRLVSKATLSARIILPEFDAHKTPHIDIFDGNFRIDLNNHLPAFSTEYSRAFRVIKLIDNEDDYFATICSSSNPPRLSQIFTFQNMNSQNVMLPIGWDLVWDSHGQQFPVILYNLPHGDPLINDIHGQFQPQTASAAIQRFLQPITPCINEMHSQGITYRAFSPTNLFIDIGGTQRDYLLGQCLSDPPGTMQHTVFETVTAGMADREYRGKEVSANDIYALGVMMICLMRGSVPMVHMNDYEISRHKLNMGSYFAVTEGMSVPQSIAEPLKGMLADDANDRWGLEQIHAWLSGRQTDKKVRTIKTRAKMEFHYHHHSYNSATELAAVLAHEWDDAVEHTINPDIPIWMRHGMSDEVTGSLIRELQNHVNASGGVASRFDFNLHVAFAKMLFLMNPYSPMIFQNLRFTITGFGHLYARYYKNQNSPEMSLIRALISVELIQYWYTHQSFRSTVYNSVLQEIALARQGINLERLEFGFERMLYVLYPDLPCLSPFFDKEFVYDLTNFLETLEEKLSKINTNDYNFALDRHMISYIGTRLKRNISNILRASVETRSLPDNVKAQVLLLSLLQEEFSKHPFPNLCYHVCNLLQPAVEAYNNVKLQARLKRRLLQTAQIGWLPQLLEVLEDQKLLNNDNSNYKTAVSEYAHNVTELTKISRRKEHIHADIQTRANRYSLVTCLILASFGLLTLFL